MDAEFATLEQKLEQLLALHAAAQAENRSLRDRLAAVEGANRELNDRLGLAGSRLEALLARIPEV